MLTKKTHKFKAFSADNAFPEPVFWSEKFSDASFLKFW
jgi:hypothetical protein